MNDHSWLSVAPSLTVKLLNVQLPFGCLVIVQLPVTSWYPRTCLLDTARLLLSTALVVVGTGVVVVVLGGAVELLEGGAVELLLGGEVLLELGGGVDEELGGGPSGLTH